MASTDYRVIVTMSPDTVSALGKSGFYLYGFKAVQNSDEAGRPLVWYKTQSYSANTIVSWTGQHQAYTSGSPIIPNSQIFVGFSTNIDLGETLEVESAGIGYVVNGGPVTAISILSTISTQFTCGLSQMIGATAYPTCSFPLYGDNLQVITPLEKVLLLFSTESFNTGTVIAQDYPNSMASYSPGILIDLTDDNQRDVSYDINNGWSWGGFSWARKVPANADLVPLLIEP